jgi:hypothetical protein
MAFAALTEAKMNELNLQSGFALLVTWHLKIVIRWGMSLLIEVKNTS